MNASVSFLPPTDFSGLWVPLITPFVGQAVDHEALGRLVKHLVSAGVTGLVVCGSTGEAAALSAEEQLAVLRTVASELEREFDGVSYFASYTSAVCFILCEVCLPLFFHLSRKRTSVHVSYSQSVHSV